jgi:hypothetical protein
LIILPVRFFLPFSSFNSFRRFFIKKKESCIGTLGLAINSIFLLLMVFVKCEHNRICLEQPHLYRARLIRLNRFLLILGVVVAYALIGVAAFQFKHSPIVHLGFALIFFIGGAAFVAIGIRIDHVIKTESKYMFFSLFFFLHFFPHKTNNL